MQEEEMDRYGTNRGTFFQIDDKRDIQKMVRFNR